MLHVRYQNKYIQIVNQYNTYMIEDNIKYYVIIYKFDLSIYYVQYILNIII